MRNNFFDIKTPKSHPYTLKRAALESESWTNQIPQDNNK